MAATIALFSLLHFIPQATSTKFSLRKSFITNRGSTLQNFKIRNAFPTSKIARKKLCVNAEDGPGFRGSFVFNPDEDVKSKAEEVVKEAMKAPERQEFLEKASEADLFTNLALVIKEAELYGISNKDTRLYIKMEKAAKDLEDKYGYNYAQEDIAGDWRLLFTTSDAYRQMGGMSGLSKTPGSTLKAMYQQLRRESVPSNVFSTALATLDSIEEAEQISKTPPNGTSTTVEILQVFGSALVKNEMRGVFILDRIKDGEREYTGVDQIVTEADTGGQQNMPASSRALQICTYISSDKQFRISRSPTGSLFIFQRIDDLESDFGKMGVPARGGSTWGSMFG